ncbi:GNAT family N-acetyltransferase [Blastococcus deserti]|uniref:GNAT family N-acetyltransferase n=1 Tax=Blastococcus deserti TaxID=2259033 RepID=A0ABW4XE36_9ACTN
MTSTLTTSTLPTSTLTTSTLSTTESTVDRERAVAALVTAFSTDPVIRWLYPDPDRYLSFFPRLVGLLGGDAFAAGTAEVSPDHTGVALWVAPDVASDDDAVAALFEESIDSCRSHAVMALLEQVVTHHPAGPVWYLPFIGVDPLVQGRGVGSRLLAAGLARADRDGLPAYLEASTPRNRALYLRHGFDVVGELRADDSPPLWPMLRLPRKDPER